MSCGLMPTRAPQGPGWIARPSMTYSGSEGPLIDVLPLIRTAMPPSAVREIMTPGTFAARVFSIGSLPARSSSSPLTVVAASGIVGEPEGAGFSGGRAPLPDAQPEASPAKIAHDRMTRGVNDAI